MSTPSPETSTIDFQGAALITLSCCAQVNHLFKADFFGERALLSDEPR